MFGTRLGFYWKVQLLLGMAIMFGILSPIAKAVAIPEFELLQSVGKKQGGPTGKLVQDADGNLYGATQNGGSNGLGTIYKIDKSGAYSVLYSFDGTFELTSYSLLQANDEKLYGAIHYYGKTASIRKSVVFQLDSSGVKPVYTNLYEFNKGIDEELIQGSNGKFYGIEAYRTTEAALFQLDVSGAKPVYTVLNKFDGTKETKRILFQGNDGKLYGDTNGAFGSPTSLAALFQIDNSEIKPVYTTLHEFNKLVQNVKFFQGSDGNLYGINYITPNSDGSIQAQFYRLDISKSTPAFTLLHTILMEKGRFLTSFIKGSDGKFYGAITIDQLPAVKLFQLDTSGATPAYTLLYESNSSPIRTTELIFQGSGNLYGVAYDGTFFQIETSGSTPALNILYSFDAFGLDHFIHGNDGKFYGTSYSLKEGGAVFQFDTLSYKILHEFGLTDIGSGTFGMYQGSGGMIYGSSPGYGLYQLDVSGNIPTYTRYFNTTFNNTSLYKVGDLSPRYVPIQGSEGKFLGSIRTDTDPPCNTSIFQIDTSGVTPVYNALYSFNICIEPSRVIQGSGGKFYGITAFGGRHGYGLIFQLDTSGAVPTYTVLYDFEVPSHDGLDGFSASVPPALTLGGDGKLYGSTSTGINEHQDNSGTIVRERPYNISVFQLDTSKVKPVYTVLYSYSDEGYNGPPSSVIQGNDRKLYFTTHQIAPGIPNQDNSILFRIDITVTAPVRTIVHEFNIGNGGDYWLPTSDLIKGSDGNLYGVTTGWLNGGVTGSDYGLVYQVNTSGTKPLYTELYKFNGTVDGACPRGLFQASDGNLYGGTTGGGQFNGGSIYRLIMPNVNTPPVATNDSFALTIPKKKHTNHHSRPRCIEE